MRAAICRGVGQHFPAPALGRLQCPAKERPEDPDSRFGPEGQECDEEK